HVRLLQVRRRREVRIEQKRTEVLAEPPFQQLRAAIDGLAESSLAAVKVATHAGVLAALSGKYEDHRARTGRGDSRPHAAGRVRLETRHGIVAVAANNRAP